MSVCPHPLNRVKLTFKKVIFSYFVLLNNNESRFSGDGPLINVYKPSSTYMKNFFFLTQGKTNGSGV